MKKLFKILTITAASLGAVLATTSCGDEPHEEEPGQKEEETVTLSLNKTSSTIVIGSTDTLVATAKGLEEGTAVTFTSNHEDIATVDATGKVTAVAKGTATITATYGEKTATCTVTVIKFADQFIIASVDENANIKNFKNSVVDADNEFIGETSPIMEVGDDNEFVMTPVLNILNKETLDHADPSIWDYDYEYKIQVLSGDQYVDTTEDYASFDARKCTFDFNESAIGKDFKLMVRPGGLTDAQKAKSDFAYKEALVHVSNGYNVYTPNELAYFNDVNFGDDFRQDHHATGLNEGWVNFRQAHSLDASYVAPSIFLQSDIVITKDNLPSEMFFNSTEAVGDESWRGKMKDCTDVYAHYANDFTFNGNYFNINAEAIPLSAPSWVENTDGGAHSTLFKVAYNGANGDITKNLSFKNCSYHGNAPFNDTGDGAWGLFFFKIRNTISGVNDIDNRVHLNATFDNFNVSYSFITFYGEYGPTKLTIKDSVVKNGYSNAISFYRNGAADVVNCNFSHFGGPIFLAMTDKDETIGSIDVVVDDKTVIDNWLTGSEPWFTTTMGGVPATKVPEILALNGVVQGLTGTFGTAKSYVKEEEGNKLMGLVMVSVGDSHYATYKRGEKNPVGYNASSTNIDTINYIASLGAFIFTPDAAGCAYYDGEPHFIGDPAFAGDYLQLMGNISGLGYLGAFFELI